MKSKELKVNAMYFSTRFKCYGMCVAQIKYMAYLLFTPTHKKAFSGWFHCQELEKSHWDLE